MRYFRDDHEWKGLLVAAVIVGGMLLAAECTADEWYAEAGLGYILPITPWGTALNDDYKYDWKGSNPAATFSVGRQFGDNLSVEWLHVSNLLSGFPFNNDRETGIDMIRVKYRFTFGD